MSGRRIPSLRILALKVLGWRPRIAAVSSLSSMRQLISLMAKVLTRARSVNAIKLSRNKVKDTHNTLTMAITPEIIIRTPAILFTHRSPTISSFFLKNRTPELRNRNHKPEPIKTPMTRVDAETILSSSPNPSAANTAINAKIVVELVSARKPV